MWNYPELTIFYVQNKKMETFAVFAESRYFLTGNCIQTAESFHINCHKIEWMVFHWKISLKLNVIRSIFRCNINNYGSLCIFGISTKIGAALAVMISSSIICSHDSPLCDSLLQSKKRVLFKFYVINCTN